MTHKAAAQIDFSKPRDLYNRSNRLQTSLERMNELTNPDRKDILVHVQQLADD